VKGSLLFWPMLTHFLFCPALFFFFLEKNLPRRQSIRPVFSSFFDHPQRQPCRFPWGTHSFIVNIAGLQLFVRVFVLDFSVHRGRFTPFLPSSPAPYRIQRLSPFLSSPIRFSVFGTVLTEPFVYKNILISDTFIPGYDSGLYLVFP